MRIGTSEIYRVVEAVDGVNDSLIVHLEDTDGGGRARSCCSSCSTTARDSTTLVDPIKRALRSDLSPRHVPDEIHAAAVDPDDAVAARSSSCR